MAKNEAEQNKWRELLLRFQRERDGTFQQLQKATQKRPEISRELGKVRADIEQ